MRAEVHALLLELQTNQGWDQYDFYLLLFGEQCQYQYEYYAPKYFSKQLRVYYRRLEPFHSFFSNSKLFSLRITWLAADKLIRS